MLALALALQNHENQEQKEAANACASHVRDGIVSYWIRHPARHEAAARQGQRRIYGRDTAATLLHV